MDIYLREIGKHELLTAEEERELTLRIADGDEQARNRMIECNLRLVVKIAKSYTNRGMSLDDLVGEGNLGLLHSVKLYSLEHGTRFGTYATYWIKQHILKALNTKVNDVRIPCYLFSLMSKWRKTRLALQSSLGRDPSRDEIIRELKLTPKQVVLHDQAVLIRRASGGTGQQCDSAERLAYGGLDSIESDETPTSDTLADSRTACETVAKLLRKLHPRELEVITLRFGLSGLDSLTLGEVGAAIGVSKERVRQIEGHAFKRLNPDYTRISRRYARRRTKSSLGAAP